MSCTWCFQVEVIKKCFRVEVIKKLTISAIIFTSLCMLFGFFCMHYICLCNCSSCIFVPVIDVHKWWQLFILLIISIFCTELGHYVGIIPVYCRLVKINILFEALIIYLLYKFIYYCTYMIFLIDLVSSG